MEIVYKASTGLEFNSAAACQLYELWQDSPEMGWPEFIVNNIDSINRIVQEGTAETKQEGTDWDKVARGTWVLVRDNPTEDWNQRQFLYRPTYGSNAVVCKFRDSNSEIGWRYAKLAQGTNND